MLTAGGLFSGIGGLELGLEMAGIETLWHCEIDPWCRQVLARHFEGEVHGDVRHLGAASIVRRPDILAGGFPCQDVSSAGRGAGLEGARSGLWYEFHRLVEELRPAAVIVENVASGKRKWLVPVREGLEALGYRTRALRIRACDVGAPHLRARIFVLAVADPESSGWGAGREGGSEGRGRTDVAAGGDVPDTVRPGCEGAIADGQPGRPGPGNFAALPDAEHSGRGKSPELRWRESKPGGGTLADGASEPLGKALGGVPPEPGGGGGISALPDADAPVRHECRRPEPGPCAAEHRAALARAAALRARWRALANGDSGGCGKLGSAGLRQPAGGNDSDGCDGAAAVEPALPESGMGGASDGVPARVDGFATDQEAAKGGSRTAQDLGAEPADARSTRWRWPAGRYQKQRPWEAPQLIPRPPRGTNRRVRLKALGNAIVPQCAFLVALALIDWMAGLQEERP